MKKRLMVMAVAGAFALPVVASAQSSVTISGQLKMSVDNVRIGAYGAPPTRAAGSNNSEWRLADESSRIIFGITEDLGGGMQAIGQVDWRVQLDNGADATSGNSWVGLRSKGWGTLTVGRHDLHYGKQPDDIASKAGSLKLTAISLMDRMANGVLIAGGTRTPNVLRYDTPSWGGFALTTAYSYNSGGPEAEIGSTARRGRAWNLNPSFTRPNWQLGYSHWNAKPDGAAGLAAGAEQRGDVVYGFHRWGGFKVGGAWNKSRLHTSGGADTNRRTAWTIPASYSWSSNNVYAHYTKARNDTVTVAQDGAKMFAIGYVRDLSKRTTVGLGYARITNDAGAAYNFFVNSDFGGVLGSASAAVAAGEDPRILTFTIRHGF